ncbi:MAG: outer membrane beta-barrel protein [bacterium]
MAKPSRTMILAATLAFGITLPASAQHGGNGFLFHEPQVRLSIRGGYDHANANSDVFDQAITDLTLSKRDFSGLTLGGEFAVPLGSRLDVSIDASFSHAGSGSSFRHFFETVGNNPDAPITQNTTFDRVPLTANLRYYLTPPGRQVGRLAWIPNKVVPWIGGGAGAMWYRFRQNGDFVDFNNNNIFTSTLESSDWTTTVQGMGGVDISLSPLVALRAESRYVWAKAKLDGSSFSGFDRIDLSGVQATLGLTFRL